MTSSVMYILAGTGEKPDSHLGVQEPPCDMRSPSIHAASIRGTSILGKLGCE